MANNNNNEAPVIIKKVKKKGGHGHHGGAWKVAYADFVTAMMAFFLLLWLLNATTEEQKRGLSNYFSPYGEIDGSGGSGGVLGGLSIQSEGAFSDNTPSATITRPDDAIVPEQVEGLDDESPEILNDDGDAKTEPGKMEDVIEQYEMQMFQKAEEDLRKAMDESSELSEYLDNILIDRTPEGMRIQIIDKDGKPMFAKGSAQMYDHMKKILLNIDKILAPIQNKISITGHTDATPYSSNSKTKTPNYTNWELSTDRANAARRFMVENGLPSSRIESVRGKAGTEPLDKENPASEKNRRITIIIRKLHLDQKQDQDQDKDNKKQ